MSAYPILLFLHSWVRWFILLLGIVVLIKAYSGWFGNKTYTKGDNGMSAGFMGLLHLNLLLGIILYFISPIVGSALNDFGAAMKDANLRFWAVEHAFINLIAIVIAQVGRIKAKKASHALAKHKTTAIWYTIAIILLLSRIPWAESERLFRSL